MSNRFPAGTRVNTSDGLSGTVVCSYRTEDPQLEFEYSIRTDGGDKVFRYGVDLTEITGFDFDVPFVLCGVLMDPTLADLADIPVLI